MKYRFTSAEVLMSLAKAIQERGWGENLSWEMGVHQTEPLIVGRVDFRDGPLYVVLDREMADYPAQYVYGYVGSQYVLNPIYFCGLGQFKPIHAHPSKRTDSDHNWWVLFRDKEADNGIVLPMKTVLLPSGNYDLLAWTDL